MSAMGRCPDPTQKLNLPRGGSAASEPYGRSDSGASSSKDEAMDEQDSERGSSSGGLVRVPVG